MNMSHTSSCSSQGTSNPHPSPTSSRRSEQLHDYPASSSSTSLASTSRGPLLSLRSSSPLHGLLQPPSSTTILPPSPKNASCALQISSQGHFPTLAAGKIPAQPLQMSSFSTSTAFPCTSSTITSTDPGLHKEPPKALRLPLLLTCPRLRTPSTPPRQSRPGKHYSAHILADSKWPKPA